MGVCVKREGTERPRITDSWGIKTHSPLSTMAIITKIPSNDPGSVRLSNERRHMEIPPKILYRAHSIERTTQSSHGRNVDSRC